MGGPCTRGTTLYGGVDFGLDRFSLAGARQISGQRLAGISAAALASRPGLARTLPSAGIAARPGLPSAPFLGRQTMVPWGTAARAGTRGISCAPLTSMTRAPSFAEPRLAGISAVSAPRGVDLALDEFSLTEPVTTERLCRSWVGNVNLVDDFWKGLDEGSNVSDADQRLLRSVFKHSLCDRRDEGDRFVPPDPSYSYISRLRNIVKEENEVQMRRREMFFSKRFQEKTPGHPFPSSWTSNFDIARGASSATTKNAEGIHSGAALHLRQDYKSESGYVAKVLKGVVPVFDELTEDGTRFRIYRIGNLEVRTTQEEGASEFVGVIFSVGDRAPRSGFPVPVRKLDDERIVKVTEYVEREPQSNWHRFFVVLETDQGSMIVTEQRLDGEVAWEENPANLDDRRSFSKVTRSKECGGDVVVSNMRSFPIAEGTPEGSTSNSRRRYAKEAFRRACGQVVR